MIAIDEAALFYVLLGNIALSSSFMIPFAIFPSREQLKRLLWMFSLSQIFLILLYLTSYFVCAVFFLCFVESFVFISFFEKGGEIESCRWKTWWNGFMILSTFILCTILIPRFYSFFSKTETNLMEEKWEVSLGVDEDSFIILALILLVFLTTVSSIKILKKGRN